MAEAMRLPLVTIVQQRGGPSTATVIYSQQEVNLTCFGGNGEGLRIVYSTAFHQDLYDYTIKAFDVAWRYRFPTFVLGDGYQAKMYEKVELYTLEERGKEVSPVLPFVGRSGVPGRDREPVRLRNAYSVEEELFAVLEEYLAEYASLAGELWEWDALSEDATRLLVVAHGIVFRAVAAAVAALREEGFDVGYFRPITLRPFPAPALKETARRAGAVLVVESSGGQLLRLVREALCGAEVQLSSLLRPGLGITPEDVVEECKAILSGRKEERDGFTALP